LRKNITLSGRRWKTHGSSKKSSGKEAGTKEGSEEGSPEEEIIFFSSIILNFFYEVFKKNPLPERSVFRHTFLKKCGYRFIKYIEPFSAEAMVTHAI
jgi:hypothetical protein